MARPKKRSKTVSVESNPGALRVVQPAERVATLLLERTRLLKRIAQKQKQLEREGEDLKTIAQTMFEKMRPLFEERVRLVEDIRRLFAALLVEGRLSRSAQKKVARIFRSLVDSGEIEPIESEPEPHAPDASNSDFHADESGDSWSASRAEPDVSSAKHAGGQPGNDTLRGLFRRLAVALHPDRVRDEHEQQRRTDVMKEVTRAFEEGNLARLIEIERRWLSGDEVTASASSEAAKCAELERAIRELQVQLKSLDSEMKALRKNSPLAEIFGRCRVRLSEQLPEIEMMTAAADAELDPLRRIRDLVGAFSDGRISLAEFLRGPAVSQSDPVDVADVADAMLELILGNLAPASSPPSRRKSSRRRSRAVTDSYDDIPF